MARFGEFLIFPTSREMELAIILYLNLNPGGGNPVHNCVGSLARHIDANLGAREVSGLGLLLG